MVLDDAYCGTGLFSAFASVQETIEKLSSEELHCTWLLFAPPVFVWALLFAVPVARIGKEACSHRWHLSEVQRPFCKQQHVYCRGRKTADSNTSDWAACQI